MAYPYSASLPPSPPHSVYEADLTIVARDGGHVVMSFQFIPKSTIEKFRGTTNIDFNVCYYLCTIKIYQCM